MIVREQRYRANFELNLTFVDFRKEFVFELMVVLSLDFRFWEKVPLVFMNAVLTSVSRCHRL